MNICLGSRAGVIRETLHHLKVSNFWTFLGSTQISDFLLHWERTFVCHVVPQSQLEWSTPSPNGPIGARPLWAMAPMGVAHARARMGKAQNLVQEQMNNTAFERI